jgi:hypothetical protein
MTAAEIPTQPLRGSAIVRMQKPANSSKTPSSPVKIGLCPGGSRDAGVHGVGVTAGPYAIAAARAPASLATTGCPR